IQHTNVGLLRGCRVLDRETGGADEVTRSWISEVFRMILHCVVKGPPRVCLRTFFRKIQIFQDTGERLGRKRARTNINNDACAETLTIGTFFELLNPTASAVLQVGRHEANYLCE